MAELKVINQTVQGLWAIATKLRTARMKAGSLNLESAEVKILVDPSGEPEKSLPSKTTKAINWWRSSCFWLMKASQNR